MRGSKLRTVILKPYRPGMGPRFVLETWDTETRDSMGKSRLAYRLTQGTGADRIVLFDAQDFCCSPMYAIDSDRCMAALLGFLTLRPGDTDPEYFAEYSDVQREFCEQHAEALAMEVYSRFGED